MTKTSTLLLALCSTLWIVGCGESGGDDGTHTHADGTVHKDGDHEEPKPEPKQDDHDHGEETELPAITIGDMQVELAQAHGAIEAGKEGHLIVKLPYDDKGETIVRAWIGTEDRTLSNPKNGDYAPSHGDYDIHTMAPDPLPENVMWWIEIQKPDGTKVVGSAKPITE
ncbi:MAG: hypothetical protein KTR15_02815 [Phycisphaeraceae bacterium]|nr:hypothetical protein [Phycisphaeraceae bacterium]